MKTKTSPILIIILIVVSIYPVLVITESLLTYLITLAALAIAALII